MYETGLSQGAVWCIVNKEQLLSFQLVYELQGGDNIFDFSSADGFYTNVQMNLTLCALYCGKT
jgi:hypothetical protein